MKHPHLAFPNDAEASSCLYWRKRYYDKYGEFCALTNDELLKIAGKPNDLSTTPIKRMREANTSARA